MERALLHRDHGALCGRGMDAVAAVVDNVVRALGGVFDVDQALGHADGDLGSLRVLPDPVLQHAWRWLPLEGLGSLCMAGRGPRATVVGAAGFEEPYYLAQAERLEGILRLGDVWAGEGARRRALCAWLTQQLILTGYANEAARGASAALYEQLLRGHCPSLALSPGSRLDRAVWTAVRIASNFCEDASLQYSIPVADVGTGGQFAPVVEQTSGVSTVVIMKSEMLSIRLTAAHPVAAPDMFHWTLRALPGIWTLSALFSRATVRLDRGGPLLELYLPQLSALTALLAAPSGLTWAELDRATMLHDCGSLLAPFVDAALCEPTEHGLRLLPPAEEPLPPVVRLTELVEVDCEFFQEPRPPVQALLWSVEEIRLALAAVCGPQEAEVSTRGPGWAVESARLIGHAHLNDTLECTCCYDSLSYERQSVVDEGVVGEVALLRSLLPKRALVEGLCRCEAHLDCAVAALAKRSTCPGCQAPWRVAAVHDQTIGLRDSFLEGRDGLGARMALVALFLARPVVSLADVVQRCADDGVEPVSVQQLKRLIEFLIHEGRVERLQEDRTRFRVRPY